MNRKAGNLYPTMSRGRHLFRSGNLGGNADYFRPSFCMGWEFFIFKNQPSSIYFTGGTYVRFEICKRES